MALRDSLKVGFKDWASQCMDWNGIKDELLSQRGGSVTAYEVTLEQVRRLQTKGLRPLTLDQVLGAQTSPEDIARDEERFEAMLQELAARHRATVS